MNTIKVFEPDFINSGDAYVIAEIGHNHQGSLEKAKMLITAAKQCGADAVKLQKRDSRQLFTKALYNQPYDSPNSYGPTYGQHREALEFNKEQFQELISLAEEIDIMLFATPFDSNSVEFLADLNMPAYKIASGDLMNTPMQREVALLGKPIFLSTGGGTLKDIRRAVDNILKYNSQLCIFHCTASYPVELEDMHLNVIPRLIKEFQGLVIGLSDHENGIDAASVGYMLGARVFEKHFTLNRAWKGTDQSFSLEPEGMRKLIRNLKRIPAVLGSDEKQLLEAEKSPLKKMAKSIVAARDLEAGTVLTEADLALKAPSGGLPPYELESVIGREVELPIKEEEFVLFDNLK